MGSTWGEWDATSTATSRAITPLASHSPISARTESRLPPTTADCGDATTDSTTSDTPRDASSDSTCWAGSSTDAMAPDPETLAMRRDRRQITLTPSAFDSAPATTAAAASPIECPMTAPGRTPYDSASAARPT